MKKETLKNEDNIIEAKCILDEKESSRIRNTVLREYRENFAFPGFRPGKVPDKIIKQRFKDRIEQELRASVFSEAVKDFRKEGFFFSVKPEYTFGIDDKEYSFSLSYSFIPKFALPNYSDYTVTTTPDAVKDEEIAEEIRNFLRHDAVFKPAKDASKQAAVDDQVILSATLYKDAAKTQAIDSKATDFEVELHENQISKDFVQTVIGKKQNEKGSFTGKVTPYLKNTFALSEDVAEVSIDFAVKEIKSLEYPELTEEYIQTIPGGGYESVEVFKNEIRNGIEARKKEELKKKQEDELFDKLLADSKIDISEAVKKGLTEKPAKEGETPEPVSAEEAEKTLKEVKKECLVEAIAEEEGLSVSEQEVAQEKDRFCRQFGPQYYEMLAAQANESMLYQALVTRKVMDFLRNIAISNA